MFDFKKIKIRPSYSKYFEPPATEEQIIELEQYCRHSSPENYNGGRPEAKYFDVIDKVTGVPLERKIHNFYFLNDNRKIPDNIWWMIENYSNVIGQNTLPFADDGLQQFYYMKWINGVPQIWYFTYVDIDEPEIFFIKDSFDELLASLYDAP